MRLVAAMSALNCLPQERPNTQHTTPTKTSRTLQLLLVPLHRDLRSYRGYSFLGGVVTGFRTSSVTRTPPAISCKNQRDGEGVSDFEDTWHYTSSS